MHRNPPPNGTDADGCSGAASAAPADYFFYKAVGSAQPELPDQLVRCLAGDPHPLVVDAEEVMRRAEAEQVGLVVTAAMGPILDVVQVRGGPTASRNLTAVAVADQDPLPLRHALLHVRFPDGNEVRGQLHQTRSQ